ncbi:MAG: tetratricopeptide repeat protein [Pseudomonadota bacterium]
MDSAKRPGVPGRFVVRAVTQVPHRLVLLCLLLLCMTSAQADRVVDEAMAMARVGAAELALNLLAEEMPDPRAEPVRWMEREQARIEILGMNSRWEQVVERTARIPVEMPVEFVIWTRTRQAHALIALGRGHEARDVLRPLIWFGRHNASESWFRSWRRLVAESYDLDDRPEDALTALRRYRFDYPDDVARVALMEAHLLLQLERPREAVDALESVEESEADALRLLARLRAEDLSATDTLEQALARAQAVGRDTRDGARYQAIAAHAVQRGGDTTDGLAIMERALASQRILGEGDEVFHLSADLLWEHYARLGEREANRRQWLLGDDADWLERAAQLHSREPHLSRGILALVALRSPSPSGREQAHRQLGEQLARVEGHGQALLHALYLGEGPFGSPEQVPDPVRHLLVEQALEAGDLATASALMAGLHRPPEGVDPFDWGLRRARALILGGQEEAGIDGLYDVLSDVRRLEADPGDRFMQVMFDLQTVGRHDEALNLFQALAPRLVEARQRRELWFWTADSYRALDEHAQAARYYLRSAMAGNSTDLWGLSARFQAAQALADAGLVDDARALYEDLLERATEPGRRIMLRQRLQQLMLVD